MLSSDRFFLVITLHTQVQTLAHFINEIGSAVALAVFDVGISVINHGLFHFDAEQFSHLNGEFVYRYFTVVDATHRLPSVH